ncbi:MAG: UDP-N-acetylmuramate dehydrogenase [Candidatus Kerfeldbacteria bacterium]|nr:UDP-N-acetylmuramate dehydrogenase [Candidatus Kerfeldbacteria bacterium]
MFEGLAIQEQVPLAPFTTFKIGGPAKYFLRAKGIAELVKALADAEKNKMPVYILGGGSNVLINDKGFAGLVIKMEMGGVEINDNLVKAGAGLPLSSVIRTAVGKGLAGLEFSTGVPASVGGAVWANLGCRGSEISKVLSECTATDHHGNIQTFTNEQCQFKYRDSIFKHQPLVILDATFKLLSGDAAILRKLMVELSNLKKQEQNVGEDTAGCTFRNPPDSSKSAAQLIDELGLKGYRIGDAMVSATHANFILNVGHATADQVVQLVSYVKQQVRDKAGVQLMEEIEYVGF